MGEYQVIARKWRPKRFSDVVGQGHVVRTLLNAICQNRTAHAYLFVGPRGVGKTTLARIFAKALNCANPQDGEPCCECESCRAIASDSSLDVIEVDAASRNSVDTMRDLTTDVLTAPSSSKYKVYIIDEVHMLSAGAWNVLLKTIEEPPAHVKFIFATTEVHKVLPTILSRCQRFDLLPIPVRLISERLRLIADTEKVPIDNGAIEAIARAAEGGMRDAQSLLDQLLAFFSGDGKEQITGDQVLSLFALTDRSDLEQILVAMLRNAPGDVVSLLGKLAGKGKNLETLFDDLLALLRAVQLSMLINDPRDLLDEGEEAIARYRDFGKIASIDKIGILLENLAPIGRVLHDAVNKQVYLETMILKAMREAHAVRLADVLNRLMQLRSAGELKFIDNAKAAGDVTSVTIQIINNAISGAIPEKSEVAPVVDSNTVKKKPESVVAQVPDESSIVDSVVASDPSQGESTELVENPNSTPQSTSVEYSDSDNSDYADSDDNYDAFAGNEGDFLSVGNADSDLSNQPAVCIEPDNVERKSVINNDLEAIAKANNVPFIKDLLQKSGGKVVDVHR